MPRARDLAEETAWQLPRLPPPESAFIPWVLDVWVDFAEGSAEIATTESEALEQAASRINRSTLREVLLVGTADPFEGDEEVRGALGTRRAEAVKAALVELGVDADLVRAISDPNRWTRPSWHPAVQFVSPDPEVRAFERRVRFQLFVLVL